MPVTQYRKVSCRFWLDEKVRGLPRIEKLVFLFLLTGPQQSSFGIGRGRICAFAEDCAENPEEFRDACKNLETKGIVIWSDGFYTLPNFLRYNPPENPNVVRSWRKICDLLPSAPELRAYIEQAREIIKGFSEGFQKAFLECFPETEPGLVACHESHVSSDSEQPNEPPAPREFSPDVEKAFRWLCEDFADAGHKVPATEKQVRDGKDVVRLMLERDKITMDEIEGVLEFVKQDTGSGGWPGWRAILQSPRGLRKHWDKLKAQADSFAAREAVAPKQNNGLRPGQLPEMTYDIPTEKPCAADDLLCENLEVVS